MFYGKRMETAEWEIRNLKLELEDLLNLYKEVYRSQNRLLDHLKLTERRVPETILLEEKKDGRLE